MISTICEEAQTEVGTLSCPTKFSNWVEVRYEDLNNKISLKERLFHQLLNFRWKSVEKTVEIRVSPVANFEYFSEFTYRSSRDLSINIHTSNSKRVKLTLQGWSVKNQRVPGSLILNILSDFWSRFGRKFKFKHQIICILRTKPSRMRNLMKYLK